MSSAPGHAGPPGGRAGCSSRRVRRSCRSRFGVSEQGVTTARLDGGGSDRATVVCGFLGCDAKPYNPLLASLPRMLRMPGVAAEAGSWVVALPALGGGRVEPPAARRRGGARAHERDAVRRSAAPLRGRPAAGADGLARGHARPGRRPGARAACTRRPAEAWTLERLGEEAGLSRSVLHERFVHFIGQPPMQYLAQWRMQLAAGVPARHGRQVDRDRPRRGLRERGGLLARVPPRGGRGPRRLAARAARVREGSCADPPRATRRNSRPVTRDEPGPWGPATQRFSPDTRIMSAASTQVPSAILASTSASTRAIRSASIAPVSRRSARGCATRSSAISGAFPLSR